MTKLIVAQFDADAPGSQRVRDIWFAAMAEWQGAATIAAKAAAYIKVRDLVVERAETDDGTPVDEALAQISASQFDNLIMQVLSGGEETIPPASSGN